MKYFISAIFIFTFLLFASLQKKPNGNDRKLSNSSIKYIEASLLDSFEYRCNRYAECICAEGIRIVSTISPKDTMVIFISCYEKSDRPILKKDSSYCFRLKEEVPSKILLVDPYEKTVKGIRYWCDQIFDKSNCR
jgi:hypothetical protein